MIDRSNVFIGGEMRWFPLIVLCLAACQAKVSLTLNSNPADEADVWDEGPMPTRAAAPAQPAPPQGFESLDDYRLAGVMVGKRDAFAVFEDRQTKRSTICQVGDSIGDNGAVVQKIAMADFGGGVATIVEDGQTFQMPVSGY